MATHPLRSTSHTGSIGELIAARWYISRGLTVLFPMGHQAFDLVCMDSGGGMTRVQVKSGTQSQRTTASGRTITYTQFNVGSSLYAPDAFDNWCLVCVDTGRIWEGHISLWHGMGTISVPARGRSSKYDQFLVHDPLSELRDIERGGHESTTRD